MPRIICPKPRLNLNIRDVNVHDSPFMLMRKEKLKRVRLLSIFGQEQHWIDSLASLSFLILISSHLDFE